MQHQGGATSKLSTDLGNLRRKIQSGVTRGDNPRPCTVDEMEQFRKQEKQLGRLQHSEEERLRAARVKSYITKEANTVIDVVKEATSNFESLFLGCRWRWLLN